MIVLQVLLVLNMALWCLFVGALLGVSMRLHVRRRDVAMDEIPTRIWRPRSSDRATKMD